MRFRRRAEDLDSALTDCKTALELAPESLDVHMMWADTLLKMKRREEAVKAGGLALFVVAHGRNQTGP